MGEKCQICGYDRCITALELHHINPSEKDFSFNQKDNMSWERLQPELQKCILVCANCHREIHQNLITQELLSSYNTERAEEISQKIKDLTHKTYYCKECGAIVSRGKEHCPQCAALMKRVVERPTREELKSLIRTESFVDIGRRFKVTDNAIRKWCDSYSLPRKKTDIKKYTDEEWKEV